ncbi:biotin transporter BioY [Acidovorax sp. LjRoot129]|uniref:RCC1 domain-containing protein n=1 Tax=unclassified Acidovorax TaxID=2684926 RepID=UPI003ECF1B38
MKIPIKNCLALLAAATVLCAALPAAGQNYWVIKPVPGLKNKTGDVDTEPSIKLDAGTLPDAVEGKAFIFDLKTYTHVTGGPGITSVQYALGGGSVPSGISLSSDGQLAGTPTAKTTAQGASFTVVGTYEMKTGQQVYTLKVGEAVLQVVQIATSYAMTLNSHACAVTTSGAAKCWGTNSFGQLGDGTTTNSNVPVPVVGLSAGVSSISVSGNTTCAVVAGAAKCWGNNSFGQVGNGTTGVSLLPAQVVGLASGVASVSAGHGFACAATTSGSAKCWGSNASGQLGDGTSANSNVPVQVAGLDAGVTSISASSAHACATVGGSAKCWGSNFNGNLGDGTTQDSNVPKQVAGLTSGVSSLVAGSSHSCAVVSGAAKCWGLNGHGQLGDGSTNSSSTPVAVAGLSTGVSSVSPGGSLTCAVASGAAKCWGFNHYGQLGDGSTAPSAVPVQVLGLATGVTQVSAGTVFSCAVVNSAVKCWGWNNNGQLGDGSNNASGVPVNIKAGR